MIGSSQSKFSWIILVKSVKSGIKFAGVLFAVTVFLPLNNRSYATVKKTNAVANVKSKTKFSVKKTFLSEFEGVNFDKQLNLVVPQTVDKPLALTIKKSIQDVLSSLDSVLSKGYLNTPDHPFLKNLIVNHFKDSEGKPAIPNIQKYELVYNFLLLNMYLLGKSVCRHIKPEEEEDLFADYEILNKRIYQRISALIRNKIQKRGVSIKHNMYTGYDTEYYLKDEAKDLNELLSIQLALNTRYIVNIPVTAPFDYKDSLNTLTGDVYKGKESSSDVDMLVFNNCINNLIKRIREFEYPNYDDCMKTMVEKLDGLGFQKIMLRESSCVQFVTKLTETKTCFKLVKNGEYKFSQILEDCESLIQKDLTPGLFDLFNQLGINPYLSGDVTGRLYDQKSVRTTTVLGEGVKLSVSLVKNHYICCHLSTADLSLLSDFEELKNDLDIVQKTFVTIGRLRSDLKEKSNIYIRDTSLLAPAGFKSLASVGSMYGGEYDKVTLPAHYRGNMKKLLQEDPLLFEKYAVQDSVVTLKHANTMEDFLIKQGKTGVPLTLSSLGRDYILNEWRSSGYSYQSSNEILLGDTSAMQTPSGINIMKEVGLYMSHYIANYKGGRNESYMYGCDRSNIWFDYDVTSAYTTAMVLLGNPDYRETKIIFEEYDAYLLSESLLNSYTVIKTKFSFPEKTKFPSIPCYLRSGKVTVYPLEGNAILTGPEFLVARNQGCNFKIEYLITIPFTKVIDDKGQIIYTDKPFYKVIKDIQKMRREYPKKTINNVIYKEMGNSIYGNVVKGISNKKLFDVKTKRTLPTNANALSNPVLACYITGLIRSLLGECLHNIDMMDGKIVSSTTDGFITNIEGLEDRLLQEPKCSIELLKVFRDIRTDLSGDPNTLELKSQGKGIISWATRGQLGIESSIKATTGFQAGGFDKKDLVSEFLKTLGSESKSFEQVQSRLRSGKDIYEKGGHVTMKYTDRDVSLHYDNRRVIIEEGTQPVDLTDNLLDSKPFKNTEDCERLRGLKSIIKTISYSRFSPTTLMSKKYQKVVETAARTFIKGLLAEKPLYGLDPKLLPKYGDIINFVKGYEGLGGMSLTKSSISHLKNRKTIIKNVPRTPETIKFSDYISKKFPYFSTDDFLK